MIEKLCQACKLFFADNEENSKLADDLEKAHPKGRCERCSVGEGSIGPIDNSELLYRLIVDPRDYDNGVIIEQPFRKVYRNGLSLFRESANNEEITEIAMEGLRNRRGTPTRQIYALCEFKVSECREVTDTQERVFCVYDQTVSRVISGKTPFRSHAGIFQRWPLPGTAGRSIVQKDHAGKLKELITKKCVSLPLFRNGMLVALNRRAASGEFAFD